MQMVRTFLYRETPFFVLNERASPQRSKVWMTCVCSPSEEKRLRFRKSYMYTATERPTRSSSFDTRGLISRRFGGHRALTGILGSYIVNPPIPSPTAPIAALQFHVFEHGQKIDIAGFVSRSKPLNDQTSDAYFTECPSY
jgi:hypothetical protein